MRCREVVPGTQNLCTRLRGHVGEHRCSAADVDADADTRIAVLPTDEVRRCIAELDERVARFEAILREIAEARGRFSLDQKEFANNVIERQKALARHALDGGRLEDFDE